jgi:hypothetical protein
LRVVPAADGGAQELEELTGLLRCELLDLEVDSVDPLAEQNPPNWAKGLGTLAGWLAVHFVTVERLRAVVTAVRDWVSRTDRLVEISRGADVQ